MGTKKIQRKSIVKQSILWEDVYSMIRVSLPRFILMSVIIGFLLFFLNVLVGVSNHAHSFSDTVQSKLGMYVYIDESEQTDATYNRVLSLQEELENAWVETRFVSKDDAEAFLVQRIPDIVEQFEYYDIENPFPPTLYIMIQNNQQYQEVVRIVPWYSEIILNIADLTSGRTLEDQEKRIIRTMQFTQAVIAVSYFLIIFFSVIITVIVLFILQQKAREYHDTIALKKLLGASYLQIKMPFLVTGSFLLAWGFVVMLVLLLFTNTYLHQYDLSIAYFAELFDLSIAQDSVVVRDYVWQWTWLILIEIVVLTVMLWLISNVYLHRLVKKM